MMTPEELQELAAALKRFNDWAQDMDIDEFREEFEGVTEEEQVEFLIDLLELSTVLRDKIALIEEFRPNKETS
jgi:hypothetical protein